MNKIKLSALGITTESERHLFRDDGFVSDMGLHYDAVVRELFELRGAKEIENGSRPTNATSWGKHLIAYLENSCLHVVFYVDCGYELNNLCVRGHEETHALHAIGQIHLLQKGLNKLGLPINLKKYHDYEMSDTEYVANIGGLYAAHRAGATIVGIEPERNPDHLKPALLTYQRALKNPFRPLYKAWYSLVL